jgi:transposase
MNVLHERCAGLDLADDGLVAGVRIQTEGKVETHVQGFFTNTKGLLTLSAWLSSHGVTHVVMEATGSYWRAVWQILEDDFELTLANPRDVKAVPQRKSDVNDALWLASLLAHGLIRGSFVPPTPIQDLRDLTRTRKQLGREIVQHTQRIQKVLDTANIKLPMVMSDVVGVSGRAMLRALISGVTDPETLADAARGSLRKKRPALVDALTGRVREHHRVMLKLHLDLLESIERSLDALDARIKEELAPFRRQADLVRTIPGMADVATAVLIAEIGVDMSQFPSASHLISWSCMCPRLDITGGKAKSTRLRQGANWLKTMLVQAAWAATRKKNTYLRSLYYRIRARRGGKKAIVAVAASMLTAAYHMLKNDVPYHDLGPDFLPAVDKAASAKRLVKQLNRLGFGVTLEAAA